jgi:8-oxo-dGTP diphosphatase
VLVFPWQADKVLICEIAGRGWCVPSGHVEPGESAKEAARRETLEESGATLGDLHYLGCYQIRERREVRWAELYAADVIEMGEILAKEESQDRRFVALAELPQLYHVWNPLAKQVFEHAYQAMCRSRRLND